MGSDGSPPTAVISLRKNRLSSRTKGVICFVGPVEVAVAMARVFSLEELAKHNTESDCYVAVNGVVLDVTSYLSQHPGGKKVHCPSWP